MPQLQIYVSAHCFGREEAERIAASIATRYGQWSVQVVDLDAVPDARPDCVVAVPAYLLDGEIIAFGNPREQELIVEIEEAAAAERVG